MAAVAIALAGCSRVPHQPQFSAEINPPPSKDDWLALARLPDWSGVWNPNISDQNARIKTDPVPWNAAAAKEVADLVAEEHAGRPKGLFVDCLPEGMPSWMLITHNALEFLYSPGRVTILGESDGNRIRRIYTDGRSHPADPDLTFHGHSTGHWEGDTLTVDTVGVLPQAILAISESVGLPNDGALHVVENIRLSAADVLQDDLEITAPKILDRPWKTSRSYFRQRAKKFDIVEGVCLEGFFAKRTDSHAHAVFVPIPQTPGGNPQADAR
jgi:hypothetical protein